MDGVFIRVFLRFYKHKDTADTQQELGQFIPNV